jgi:hypothetical protein
MGCNYKKSIEPAITIKMAKKKRKYFIDVKDSMELLRSCGFKIITMNWYQIRVTPEEGNSYFDWFHTQGTVTINTKGACSNIGECSNADHLSDLIKKKLYGKNRKRNSKV